MSGYKQSGAVLFDMDGVLVDSEVILFGRLRESLLEFAGVDVPLETLYGYAGMTSAAVWQALARQYRLRCNPEVLRRQHRQKWGDWYIDPPDIAPIPGAQACLAGLARAGVPVGVVSSTTSARVLAALSRTGLLAYCRVVVCGDMVQNPKPAPDPYLLAARWLAVEPCRCIAVEDAPLGIQAAKAAGMRVIGLSACAHPLDTSLADFREDSFAGLANRLAGLLPSG